MERQKVRGSKAQEGGTSKGTETLEFKIAQVKSALSSGWSDEDIKDALEHNVWDVHSTVIELLEKEPPQWEQVSGKRAKGADNKGKPSTESNHNKPNHRNDRRDNHRDGKQPRNRDRPHDNNKQRGEKPERFERGERGKKKGPLQHKSQPKQTPQQEQQGQPWGNRTQQQDDKSQQQSEEKETLVKTEQTASTATATIAPPFAASQPVSTMPSTASYSSQVKSGLKGEWKNRSELKNQQLLQQQQQQQKQQQALAASASSSSTTPVATEAASANAPAAASTALPSSSSPTPSSSSAASTTTAASSAAPVSASSTNNVSPSTAAVSTRPIQQPQQAAVNATTPPTAAKSYHPPGMVWKPKDQPLSSSSSPASTSPIISKAQEKDERTDRKTAVSSSNASNSSINTSNGPTVSLNTGSDGPVILRGTSVAAIDRDQQDFSDVHFGSFGASVNPKAASTAQSTGKNTQQSIEGRMEQLRVDQETGATNPDMEAHHQMSNHYPFLPPYIPTFPPPFAYDTPDNSMRQMAMYEQAYQQPPLAPRETSPTNESASYSSGQQRMASNQGGFRDAKYSQGQGQDNAAAQSTSTPQTQPTPQGPFPYGSRQYYYPSPYQYPAAYQNQPSQYPYPRFYAPPYPNYPASSSFTPPSTAPSTAYTEENLMQDYQKNVFPQMHTPFFLPEANMMNKTGNPQGSSPPPTPENPQYKQQQGYQRDAAYYNVPQQYQSQPPSNFSLQHMPQQQPQYGRQQQAQPQYNNLSS